MRTADATGSSIAWEDTILIPAEVIMPMRTVAAARVVRRAGRRKVLTHQAGEVRDGDAARALWRLSDLRVLRARVLSLYGEQGTPTRCAKPTALGSISSSNGV